MKYTKKKIQTIIFITILTTSMAYVMGDNVYVEDADYVSEWYVIDILHASANLTYIKADNSVSAIWQVAWGGYNNVTVFNQSIPSDCFEANSQNLTVDLRTNSTTARIFCLNSTGMKFLNETIKTSGIGSTCATFPPYDQTKITDGNWSSGSFLDNAFYGGFCRKAETNNTGGFIYEDAMIFITESSSQCNTTINTNWVISDSQICDGLNVNLGTGNVTINSIGTLRLINGANVTANNFILNRQGDSVFINSGSYFTI